MRSLIVLAILALAACTSDAPAPTPGADDVEAARIAAERGAASPTPTPTPRPSATPPVVAGSAPAPVLMPVPAEAAATLAGELRCNFARDDGAVLMVAAADVAPAARASAVLRTDRGTAALAGIEAGGFNAMARGVAFGGAGLVATLARGAPDATGHEGTRHRAALTLVREGAVAARADGWWTCGP